MRNNGDNFKTYSNNKKTYDQPPKNQAPQTLIPWKGKILNPTPAQLLRYGGNLNEVAKHIGSRDPIGREANFREIRIEWKGQTLTPTPRQILVAKGDLNQLRSYLNPARRNSTYFQKTSGNWTQEPGNFRPRNESGRR